MRKSLVKTLAVTMAAVMCAGMVSGCGAGSESKKADTQAEASGTGDSKTADKSYELTVSGIGGSLNYLPIYIAEQEGWFKEKGLDIEEVLFTNGPVQMESLSSDGWDIGCTGVGGVFAGVLGYDALVLGSSNTDDGTQYVFARNDSDIVKAGKGHNSLSDEIYGDADSWKGKSILCNTGSVTQYVLIKVLEGFGLTVDDVNFIAMFLSVTLLSVMFPVMSLSVFHALSGKPSDQSGAGRIIEVGESCHHLFCCSHTGPAAAALWLGSRHTKFILPAIAVPVMKFMAFYLLPFPEIGKAAVGPQGYVSKPAGFPGPVSVALQDPCHGKPHRRPLLFCEPVRENLIYGNQIRKSKYKAA